MTIAYKTIGAGPQRVVALHDWTTPSQTFDGIHPVLDTDTFTYAFVDLRGYGASKGIKGEYTSKEAARDVIEVADELGWAKFHIAGHSMSGMIAQRVNLDFPKRVISMVAITPVPASGVPVDDEGRALFTGAASDPEKWRMVAGMLTADRLPEAWYKMKHKLFEASVDKDAFLGFFDMWTGENFADRLRDMQTPALALLGEHDFQMFTEESMRQTLGQCYPDLKIITLPNAAHYPMAETPLSFVKEMEDFMREAA